MNESKTYSKLAGVKSNDDSEVLPETKYKL